ncbi:phage head closure protein [Alsobacter sp. SYSU M60028]|uniref:Phage head closure protein n=1 Tax=Alsobacter ponti TaxID=2962936 RepID=A0ABT1L8F5_9HYPH|nr:phage head closure protein [Alsobacter ponti]
MSRPAIADRRARVTLLAPVETPDGFGGVLRSFSPRACVWAAFEPLRAADAQVADAPGQVVTHRVTLRRDSGVDASMRLQRGARLFTVQAVFDPDERRRDLVCLCEEVKP